MPKVNGKKEKKRKWCCRECGLEANRLTCLKRYGQEPKKKSFDVSTMHEGICDVCGRKTWVTQPRDFFCPDFSLLKVSSPKDDDNS